MGVISIMDKEAGDIKIGWNPDNEEEVAVAKKQFDDMKKKGFKPFRMFGSGKPGEEMESFDKFAEKILFVMPMKGG